MGIPWFAAVVAPGRHGYEPGEVASHRLHRLQAWISTASRARAVGTSSPSSLPSAFCPLGCRQCVRRDQSAPPYDVSYRAHRPRRRDALCCLGAPPRRPRCSLGPSSRRLSLVAFRYRASPCELHFCGVQSPPATDGHQARATRRKTYRDPGLERARRDGELGAARYDDVAQPYQRPARTSVQYGSHAQEEPDE